MILYAMWMIRDWQRNTGHGSFPFPGSDVPAPWFMYTFLGLGVIMCVITCSGHIAAETVNGCCLCTYMVFVFLLLMLEAAVTVDVFLNYSWEQDFPVDPSGNFDKFKEFVRKNFEFCKWVGLSVVSLQGLCVLLAMIVKALGPHDGHYYDSDDDYTPEGVPLLRSYVRPTYVAGDAAAYGPRNDTWNRRVNDKASKV